MYIIHRYHIYIFTHTIEINRWHTFERLQGKNKERIKMRLGKGHMMYLDCYLKNKDHIKNLQPTEFLVYSKRFSI